MSMKKENISSSVIYKIISFCKMAEKTEFFFREQEVEFKLVKYLENLGYWENLLLFWMNHLIFILWVFICPEWTISTLEKNGKYVQS